MIKPGKKRIELFSIVGPFVIFLIIGILKSLNDDHSEGAFLTFQYFRIIHNNIHHLDISNYLPMVHPALAEEKYTWSSALTPSFQLLCTIWSYIFELSVNSLRILAVLYHSLYLVAMLYLSRALGLRTFWSGWLVLLASQFVLFSSTLENFTLFFYMFIVTFTIDKNLNDKKKYFILFFAGIISASFFFLTTLILFITFTLFAIHDKFSKPEQAICQNWKFYFTSLSGCSISILIGIFHQYLAMPEDAMSIFDYFFSRTHSRTISIDPMLYLDVLHRLWGFISECFPCFIFITMAVGLYLFNPIPENRKKENIVFIMLISYLIFLLILGKASIYHPYFIFFFMVTGSVFAHLVFSSRTPKGFNRYMLLVITLILMAISLRYYRISEFWVNKKNSLDTFLSNMSPNDFLVRETPSFNTWPLNYNAPEKTIYIKPGSLKNALADINNRNIIGYETTEHTIYHLKEKYGKIKYFKIPQGSKVYFFTFHHYNNQEKIEKNHKFFIYRIL